MDQNEYRRETEAIRELIAARLDLRAPSFEAALRRAGRALPRASRRASDVLLEHGRRLGHPRLAARTDPAAARAAVRTMKTQLGQIPEGLRRARRRSALAAEIAFRIAVAILLGLAALSWLGLL